MKTFKEFLLEQESIPQSIEVNGKTRPTKNSEGKFIANTVEKIVNFWMWFGDSKTVDTHGRPMVLFHGARDSFDAFSAAKGKLVATTVSKGKYIFASNQPMLANTYAFMLRSEEETGTIKPNVMPVYMRMLDPMINDVGGHNWDDLPRIYVADKERGDLSRVKRHSGMTVDSRPTTDKFVKAVIKHGVHDGVIFKNVHDFGGGDTGFGINTRPMYDKRDYTDEDAHIVLPVEKPKREDFNSEEDYKKYLERYNKEKIKDRMIAWGFDTYVVFDPKNVKSAIGNKGTFNSTSKKITESN